MTTRAANRWAPGLQAAPRDSFAQLDHCESLPSWIKGGVVASSSPTARPRQPQLRRPTGHLLCWPPHSWRSSVVFSRAGVVTRAVSRFLGCLLPRRSARLPSQTQFSHRSHLVRRRRRARAARWVLFCVFGIRLSSARARSTPRMPLARDRHSAGDADGPCCIKLKPSAKDWPQRPV